MSSSLPRDRHTQKAARLKAPKPPRNKTNSCARYFSTLSLDIESLSLAIGNRSVHDSTQLQSTDSLLARIFRSPDPAAISGSGIGCRHQTIGKQMGDAAIAHVVHVQAVARNDVLYLVLAARYPVPHHRKAREHGHVHVVGHRSDGIHDRSGAWAARARVARTADPSTRRPPSPP